MDIDDDEDDKQDDKHRQVKYEIVEVCVDIWNKIDGFPKNRHDLVLFMLSFAGWSNNLVQLSIFNIQQ